MTSQIDKVTYMQIDTDGVGRGCGERVCVLIHVCLFHDSKELSLADLSIAILISFINHLLYTHHVLNICGNTYKNRLSQ